MGKPSKATLRRRAEWAKCLDTRPKHIALLGMGYSIPNFIFPMQSLRGKDVFPEETWICSFMNTWARADKHFFMDGFDMDGEYWTTPGEIEGYEDKTKRDEWDFWLENYARPSKVPIITSIANDDFPATVAYPLEDVINNLKEAREFCNSMCYAMAYAIHIGVERIDCFGFDFDYQVGNRDVFVYDKDGQLVKAPSEMMVKEEDARGSLQFWAGFARGRGIQVNVGEGCRFLKTTGGRFYGYPEDAVTITAKVDEESPSNLRE